MAGERRLYLERNCRLPESPAHSRRRNREGPASSKGLNSQRGFGPAVEPRRKSRPRSTSLHGSSPCKCQRLSTLRWDRLPPSRPSTKSGARAGGRRLSDRRLHRWLAGTSASAPSSHGAADLLGLNRAHICVRNPESCTPTSPRLSGTPVPSLASLSPGWPCSGGTSSPPCFACCSPMRGTTSVSQHVIVLGCYDSAVACPRSRARAERPFVAVSAPSAIDEHGDSPASYRRRRCRTRRRPWPRRWDARSGRRVTPPGKRLEPACS